MKSTSTDARSGASNEAEKSSGISRAEWLAALGEVEVQPDNPDALSVREFAELMQLTINPARDRLYRLEQAGKAVRLKKRNIRNDGRAQIVTAWRLVKAEEAGHARTSDARRHRTRDRQRAPARRRHVRAR